MTRCLVTGGAGLIGSHLVDALLGRGHDVRVLDSFGQIDVLEGELRSFELVHVEPRVGEVRASA